MAWTDFVTGMGKFSIGSQSAWCEACGNSTGVCAPTTAFTSPSSGGASTGSGSRSGSSESGISKAVAGVIGAMVTLAVILGVEGLIMLVAGFRLVRKNRLSAGAREGAVAPKNGNA